MNKKLVSLVTMTSIIITSASPMFAKNFTSKQNVALDHAWTVKFNKTLASNQDFSKVTIKDSKGTVVPIDATINSDKQSVNVAPKENYSANTNYTLTVDGIKDTTGKNLKEDATLSFTTASEEDAIKPQAVTFNSDGSVTPLTTNEYVDKAYPGVGAGWYNYQPNPNYDKNYGKKHMTTVDLIPSFFIDSNNELANAYCVGETPLTYSEGFKYNKYMKDQMRELYRGFIGTTPYDGSHYVIIGDTNERDGVHEVVSFDYHEVIEQAEDNITNFSYYFPIKSIRSITDPSQLEEDLLSETWKHVSDNANLVLEIYDTNILYDNSVAASNFKESLYACFGSNYANKILDFMKQEDKKARNNLDGRWNGKDSITINNITIYTDNHGFTYSFFLK